MGALCPGGRSGAEAELAHLFHVVLDPERAGQFPAAHPEDVDLIDIGEAAAGWRVTHPFPQVGPGTPEMRSTFSPSATRSAISIVKSGKESRKGLTQRRA